MLPSEDANVPKHHLLQGPIVAPLQQVASSDESMGQQYFRILLVELNLLVLHHKVALDSVVGEGVDEVYSVW